MLDLFPWSHSQAVIRSIINNGKKESVVNQLNLYSHRCGDMRVSLALENRVRTSEFSNCTLPLYYLHYTGRVLYHLILRRTSWKRQLSSTSPLARTSAPALAACARPSPSRRAASRLLCTACRTISPRQWRSRLRWARSRRVLFCGS